MKNKYIIALFILGIIILSIGALFKITHWEYGVLNGTIIIAIGMFLKITAAIIFIIKLLRNSNNNFLNK